MTITFLSGINSIKIKTFEEWCTVNSKTMKDNYYEVELNKTVWQVPNRYTDLVPIGSGAYGQVCSASDSEQQHQTPKVAIKKLARPFQSAIHAKRTYRELRMLKHMKHENIIGLINVFTPATGTYKQKHSNNRPDDFNKKESLCQKNL